MTAAAQAESARREAVAHAGITASAGTTARAPGAQESVAAAAQAESVAAAAQAESARREAVAHAGITASAGTTAHAPGVQAA